MPSLLIAQSGPLVTLTLNRPDVRNALDDQLIASLAEWARGPLPPDVRVAILKGAGKVFCAGADLAWMSRMVGYSQEENVRDARRVGEMLEALDALPVPLIGRIHGAALGGGGGLAAVCDIAVTTDDAVFGFTEAKLGILPAVISPFVLAKIGRSAARELFLTASRFSADRAREIGLVHAVVAEGSLDAAVDAYVREILTSGPQAIRAAKELIAQVAGRAPDTAGTITAEALAARRVSEEGQAGMRAFIEKRRAPWVPAE